MSPATAARTAATYTPSSDERNARPLTQAEQRVRNWIVKNHGVLSRVATETGLSVQFVQRIAYNYGNSRSAGLKVERKLQSLGCPLIQKF